MSTATQHGSATSVELYRIAAEHNEVAVLWYRPRRDRGVSIVAGHGYSSSKQNLDMLCWFLASHGFGMYSLDFPGHKLGSSGGELRGIEDCIDAMRAAIAFARRHGGVPVYAMGHSMGGTTALLAAAEDAGVRGVIAIATGYGRPSALDAMRNAGFGDFRASYVNGVDLPALFAGVDERLDEALPKLAKRPALYVAAKSDAVVSISSVRELYERAPQPKAFAAIESDHTNAGERSRAEVLQWLNQLHPRA
jgi:alpha-beta hydrolase superfamily lysophospholipase